MAIRYTPDLNARMRRTVREYNRRVRRANTEGKVRKSNLPEVTSVRTLKKSFNKRSDLERELKTLDLFTRESVKEPVGEYVNRYDVDVINANKSATIKHFENVVDILKRKNTDKYPGQMARIRTIEKNIDILKKDVDTATSSELESMKAYVDKYRKGFERRATGYRGFMSEVEAVMDRVGISDAQKEEFFAKFSTLTEEELYELYETKDIINRVYLLADSPKYTGGELKLHSTVKDAREVIETLMDEADMMIAEVKSKR